MNSSFYLEYYDKKWFTKDELNNLLGLTKNIPNERLRNDISLAIESKMKKCEDEGYISDYLCFDGKNEKYQEAVMSMFNNASYCQLVGAIEKIQAQMFEMNGVNISCPNFIRHKEVKNYKDGDDFCQYMQNRLKEKYNNQENPCYKCLLESYADVKHLFKVP